MKLMINLIIITISFIIPTLKVKAKDESLCLKVEIEEDTGATIYNSSQICGGLR